MGRVIPLPEDRQPKRRQLLTNAQAKRAQGDVAGAALLLKILAEIADELTPSLRADVMAELLTCYDLLGQEEDARALIADEFTALSATSAGRALTLRLTLQSPDFTSAARLVRAAADDRNDLQRTVTATEAAYTVAQAATLNQDRRRVTHLGAFEQYEQAEIVRIALPRLPMQAAKDAVTVALGDPDVAPIVRTTLVQWAREVKLDAEVTLTLLGKTYRYNPKQAPDVYSAPPVAALLKANGEMGSPLPDEYLVVLLGMLYPVADQVITEPAEFLAALTGVGGEAYLPLIDWLQKQLAQIN